MGRKNSNYEVVELAPARYSHITLELRTTLIEMVTSQDLSIYRAAKSLKINNSTAKVIIRNYRRRGHIYKRKSQRNKPLQPVQIKMEGPNSQFQNQGKMAQAANMEIQKSEVWSDPAWKNLMPLPYIFYPVYSLGQYSFGFGC